MKQKHELVDNWEARRTRRIKAGLSLSLPELTKDETAMEMAHDAESEPFPTLIHADITMEQACAHFNGIMAEEQSTPLILAFRQVQEDQRYTMELLE